MGIFSRRAKTDAAQFSRSFYDRFVFGPDPTGGDFALFAETTRRLIGEADASFREVSLPTLKEELRALRLEMIGTAWTYESKIEAAIAIGEFTKVYLANIGRPNVWGAMTAYNTAIAESTLHGSDPNTPLGRAKINLFNATRADLFETWINAGRDAEATARVVNRTGSEASWKAGTTQYFLALQVTRRVGIQASQPMLERLAAVAHGFHQGAKEALDGVQLTP